MVLAGNKGRHLLLVNHTIKTIHNHHYINPNHRSESLQPFFPINLTAYLGLKIDFGNSLNIGWEDLKRIYLY